MAKSETGRSPEEIVRGVVRSSWEGAFAERSGDLLADDFTYVGLMEDQYLVDREGSLALSYNIARTIPDVTLTTGEFREIYAAHGLHIVAGSVSMVTNPGDGLVFSSRHRVTAVLREKDDGYELVHLHSSLPLSGIPDGRGVAQVGISRETYTFMRGLAAMSGDEASIELRDCSGTTHVIKPFEVIYLESDRQHTVAHTLGGEVRVRMGIGEVSGLLPSDWFVELRRGIVANVEYVVRWSARQVVLAGDVTVPLPARRSAEIRSELSCKKDAFRAALLRRNAPR